MQKVGLNNLWICLPVLFLGALSARIVMDEGMFTSFMIALLAGMLSIYLAMFKKSLLIGLCIFSIPLSQNLVNSKLLSAINFPTEPVVFMLSLIAVLVGLNRPFYLKKLLFHPITLLLLLDIGWLVITSFMSTMPIVSYKRVLMRSTFLLVFYLLAAQWMTKKENMIKFFLLYAIGFVLPIILTINKFAFYHFDPKYVFELSLPFYTEHTVYGACLAFLIPFLVILTIHRKSITSNKWMRLGICLMTLLFIVAEIFSFSRAAWFSLAISFMMFIFLKFRLRFWAFVLLFLGAAMIIYQNRERIYLYALENENISNKGEIGEHVMSVGNLNSDASNLERVNRYLCAYRMFSDKPVTGFGPGTYQFQYGPYQSPYEMTTISTLNGDKGNAHSEFLTYLSETGLPGAISYLIWLFATVAIGIRAYLKAKDKIIKNIVLAALLGFMTFFFHGLVNSFLDQVKMASLVFGSMAIMAVVDIANRSKTDQHGA